MIDILDYLRNNDYPGRGILCGYAKDEPFIAYFIMGRSENSRNRIFVKNEDVLFTKAYDESKVKDPSLIIYNALRTFNDQIIVTNGDQTDTICEFLEAGKSFKDALETRMYEPDAPNFTPRISALVDKQGYDIAIIRREGHGCKREYYHYENRNGIGHFISTYDHNGDPLPSFSKEPIECVIEEDENFPKKLWRSLNEENKISLYVRYQDKEYIFNKNEGE